MQCARLSLLVLLMLFGSTLCRQAFAIVVKHPITITHSPGGPDAYGFENLSFIVDTSDMPAGSSLIVQVYVTVSGYTDFLNVYHPFPNGPVTIALLNPPASGLTNGGGNLVNASGDLFALLSAAGVQLPWGSTISYNYTINAEVTSPTGINTAGVIDTLPTEQAATPPNYTPKSVTGKVGAIIDPTNSTIDTLLPNRIGILLTTVDTSTVTVPISN